MCGWEAGFVAVAGCKGTGAVMVVGNADMVVDRVSGQDAGRRTGCRDNVVAAAAARTHAVGMIAAVELDNASVRRDGGGIGCVRALRWRHDGAVTGAEMEAAHFHPEQGTDHNAGQANAHMDEDDDEGCASVEAAT